MNALRVLKIEPLTARLAAGITLLIIIPLAVGLYVLARYEYGHTVEVRAVAADLETRMLEVALRGQMLKRDPGVTVELLRAVAAQPEVRRAMIVDHTGVVRYSSRGDEVGVRLSRDSPTCAVCHGASRGARPQSILFDENGFDVLRTVRPIENRPECQGCHGPGRKVNGILVFDLSLAATQAQLRAEVQRIGLATVGLTVVILLGVGWLLRRQVLVRLRRLGRTARSIAGGAFSERAEVVGSDVIGRLAGDFNKMADAAGVLITDLRRREREIAGVLNSLDDGLIVLDRNLTVVATNPSVAQRLAAEPEALQGRACREVVCPGLPCGVGREAETCPAVACLATGASQRAVYECPLPGDGDRRVDEVCVSPILGEDGSVWRVVEVWRDITERVREEERLAEIEHLSSLGVLASGLSHQLNTPLATALTCSEAILDRLETQSAGDGGLATVEAIRQGALSIRDAVLRCRSATSQFVGFARRIPLTTEPVDLVQAVQAVMALAWPTARERGVDLEMGEVRGLVPFVRANTEAVQHVVLNVLVNAIESFRQPGGKVVARFIVDDEVRLQIRDTGSGIPPEMRRHLFQPFRTNKPGGTGLGLFLSRTLMRRLNGDVRLVDSAVGRGSCVEIIFPRA